MVYTGPAETLVVLVQAITEDNKDEEDEDIGCEVAVIVIIMERKTSIQRLLARCANIDKFIILK